MLNCLSQALLAAVFLPAAVPARAEKAPQVIPLWPHGAPGEKGDVGPERELPNRPGDTVTRITDVSRPTITVFRPGPGKDTGAAVLICPGGGYSILAWNLEGTEVARWLNSVGVTGIVLKYRVPARKGQEGHLAPLQDAQRALGLVRHRAREWGLDKGKIGVLGFSAGGHLAAALSTPYEKRSYEPADDADRESCRPDFAVLVYPAYLAARKGEAALAADITVTGRTPPTFLVQTEDDGVQVENSLFYYLALKRAKVPAEMHLYAHGGHGYGLRPSSHTVSTWPQRAEQWLRALGVLKREK